MLWGTSYNFTRPYLFSVLFGHIVKFLAFTFCKNVLNLDTFWLRVHPQTVTCRRDFMRSNFKKTWTDTTDMFSSIWTSNESINRFCEFWPEVSCLAKLSYVVYGGLYPNFHFCFECDAPLTDSIWNLFSSGLSRLLSSSRFSSRLITRLVDGWDHEVWPWNFTIVCDVLSMKANKPARGGNNSAKITDGYN